MSTIMQVKSKLRHKKWVEEITECPSNGMKINEWCHMKGISYNTYYKRLRVARKRAIQKTS